VGGAYSVNRGEVECISVTVGKSEGKSLLRRPRHRCADNIKMDLVETELSGLDWIGLAWDRYRWRALMNVVMNFRVP
jgi:hypothetical protein